MRREVVPELVELEVAVPRLKPACGRHRVNRQEHHEEGDRRAQELPERGDRDEPARPCRSTVSVALAELAGELREGLLALAVGAGLQVMAAMMEDDVTAACGPKGRHDPQRAATRHGHERGSVTLGGRRVPVERPRMRAVDGSGELPVAVLRAVLLDRGAGPDGDGADAGRAVDPPLPGRARAGRAPAPSRPRQPRRARRCRGGSSRRPRPRWPSCWPRTCPGWTWWR